MTRPGGSFRAVLATAALAVAALPIAPLSTAAARPAGAPMSGTAAPHAEIARATGAMQPRLVALRRDL
ncbi:MAG TPA: hypothetical protein VGQ67_04710, partial [Candidatus Polarisedimenticolia bacterium]|nr:hypothetical protein [Candidatus Polarisedimenticolia bacterium]